MNPNDSIETTAPTVDQAVNQALAQLGAEQDDVKIEVLITPRAGVLGLGARQARVRVTRRVPEGASTGVTSPPPAPPVVRESIAATATPVRPEATSSTTASREPLVPTAAAPSEAEVPEIEQEGEIEEEPASVEELSAHPDRAEPAVLAREAT